MKLISTFSILALSTVATARTFKGRRMQEPELTVDDVAIDDSTYAGKKGYGYTGKKGYGSYAGKKGYSDGSIDECLTGKKGSYTSGKKGFGGKGAGKGGGSIIIPDYGESCVICDQQNKNKPTELVLQYVADGANSAFQPAGKATCREGQYPSPARVIVNDNAVYQLEDGDLFKVMVEGGAETNFKIIPTGQAVFEDDIDCYIHTSCSVPIVVGDQIGPFLIEGDEECEPPPEPEEPDCPECEVCDTGRPEELTLKYHSVGVNSDYQPEGKASCRAGLYPSEALITVEGATYNVADGDVFTIRPQYGSFSAETDFDFTDTWGMNCFIHTSCSVPIVPGDQIGPFEVVGDEDCSETPKDRCIHAEVGTDDEGNTIITVNFDYSNLEENRNWAENCDSRDVNCPGFGLDPLPSDWIGFYPCEEKDTTPMAFQVEPDFWAYTCYDRSCFRDDPSTATSNGTAVFSDNTIPPFASQGVYKTIAEVEKEGGGCYIVLLNKIDGYSPAPYYNLCIGNEIMIPDKSGR